MSQILSTPGFNALQALQPAVVRVELLRGGIGESEKQVDGSFEGLLVESFGGKT